MRNTCATIFAFSLPFLTWGQQIGGSVKDAETGEGLVGAVVRWITSGHGATTDENGVFQLTFEKGDTLVVSYVGYRTFATVPAAVSMSLSIELEQLSGPEVLVEGEIRAQELNMLDAQRFQTLNEKELCKAACCSLSESFETNASVDASFTDAVTGTRQIKMLGLDGRYTQVLFDNIPSVRGLSSIYGLSYIPGPWIREISISKGAGSVIAGYESITGQINVAHKGGEMKERVFLNGYAGSQGRYELNAVVRDSVGQKWQASWFAHGSMARTRFDMNQDGFLDNPLFYNGIIRTDWRYTGNKGLRGEYAITYSRHDNTSGQFDFDPSDDVKSALWGVNTQTDRVEISAKTGYVFPANESRSIGTQVSASLHDQSGVYGLRTYSGRQESARLNLMYATDAGSMARLTSGVSFTYDAYDENLDSLDFSRQESVPGVFSELTLSPNEKLSLVAGARVDVHNIYGLLFTPRLHARWSVTERTSIKVSAGRGFHSPNLIMDNVGMLATNRVIRIDSTQGSWPYGLKMEDAWTMGLVVARKFKLWYRDASISLDVYRTSFSNQIVTDWETPKEVRFYNLEGQSWSNSVQAELQWSPVKRLEWRVAYRWLDARTKYGDDLLLRPLIAQHRFFTNLSYETRSTERGNKWAFDVTARWLGRQRLPNTFPNPHEYMMHTWGGAYWIFNAQVAYHFSKRFELYAGGENLTNYTIMQPIISADNPSGEYFDASMIWGPVFGRMGYMGFRMRL